VIVIDNEGARVELVTDFLDLDERRRIRTELGEARACFEQDPVRMFGKTTLSKRLVAAFGDPGLRYRYAGLERRAHPWPAELGRLAARLSALAAEAFGGAPLNYALVNWYRDGRDRMGWHSDAEPDLVARAPIASLSLGAARPFLLERRGPKPRRRHEVLLSDGSLLWMTGSTQELYRHAVPPRAAVSEPRFNLTFRAMKT
jgi:alkylated DNA repair dioxygenase AlkB